MLLYGDKWNLSVLLKCAFFLLFLSCAEGFQRKNNKILSSAILGSHYMESFPNLTLDFPNEVG